MSRGTIQARLKACPVPIKPPDPEVFVYELRDLIAARYTPIRDNQRITLMPDKETYAWLDGVIDASRVDGGRSNLTMAATRLRQMLDDSPIGVHLWIEGPEDTILAPTLHETIRMLSRGGMSRSSIVADGYRPEDVDAALEAAAKMIPGPDDPGFDPVKAGYVTECCGAELVTEAPGSGDLTSVCATCKDRSPTMVPPADDIMPPEIVGGH